VAVFALFIMKKIVIICLLVVSITLCLTYGFQTGLI